MRVIWLCGCDKSQNRLNDHEAIYLFSILLLNSQRRNFAIYLRYTHDESSHEFHSLVPPAQAFTPKICHVTFIESKSKKSLLLLQMFSEQFCRKDSHIGTSLNNTFLTSLSQNSIIIYHLYFHNFNFLTTFFLFTDLIHHLYF